MSKFVRFFGILFILTLTNCGSKGDNEMALPETYGFTAENEVQQEQAPIERKLIKTGNIQFEVANLAKAKKNLAIAIADHGAYIVSDSENSYDHRISNTVTIRVPANKFDSLLADITNGVSRFDQKTIHVQDVTAEYIDVTTRLKTKKELENRYLEILKKANSVKEILEVERELGTLRSDIESFEGRLKYLKDQVDMATLTVTVYQVISTNEQFGNKFSTGFKNGIDNLMWFFVFLINYWPFWILLIAFVFVLRRWRSKKRSIE